jgi:phage terminase small subunit
MLIDFDKLASDLKLTDNQKKFCEFYVYVTGLDGFAAVELSGYKVDKSDMEGYDERTKEIYTKKAISYKLRELLNNNNVVKYIDSLRKNLENHLIIDKLWVIKNLKDLAMSGTEMTRIRALELLGKHLEMFTVKTKIEEINDPGEIAKTAFERRMNTIKFQPKTQNE